MWQKVSAYRSKFAVHCEKKERKAKSASSSFSFSGFSPSMPVPLCEWSSSMPKVIMTYAPSASCSVTFSSTAIISAQPFVSPNVPFAGEPCRKCKRESSENYFISKEDVWAKF